MVLDPENMETFPGFSVAPVSVTSAERMLTFVGGVSVTARTTDELPEDGVPEPRESLPRQPTSAAQKINNAVMQMDRCRSMVSLLQNCGKNPLVAILSEANENRLPSLPGCRL